MYFLNKYIILTLFFLAIHDMEIFKTNLPIYETYLKEKDEYFYILADKGFLFLLISF